MILSLILMAPVRANPVPEVVLSATVKENSFVVSVIRMIRRDVIEA